MTGRGAAGTRRRTLPAALAAEARWLWRDRYGQLAILVLLTGLMWLTGWGSPYVMLLALTRRRLGLYPDSRPLP